MNWRQVQREKSSQSPCFLFSKSSGADYSIFPVEFGEMLTIRWTDGVPWNFKGTTGKLQTAFLHEVEMSVWDPDEQFVAFRGSTDFSRTSKPHSSNPRTILIWSHAGLRLHFCPTFDF
jgi:hypothetical protein